MTMVQVVDFEHLPAALDPNLRTVVYIAEGDSYVASALISAESLRTHNAGMQVVLFTSNTVTSDHVDVHVDIATVFGAQGVPRLLALKAAVLGRLKIGPFLYLDADTYVCGDLVLLWLGLERHTFLMVQDTWRYPEIYHELHPGLDFPPGHPSIPYYNGGLLLARGDDETQEFCRAWADLILEDARFVRDQLALRILIGRRRPNFGTLPQEYNARTCDPLQLSGRVSMIHDSTGDPATRKADSLALSQEINSTFRSRLWDPALRRITYVQNWG